MKVRWLGNSCLEITNDRNILIDPNYLEEPKNIPDVILITHEHDDHFSLDKNEDFLGTADLYAPELTLEKFGLDGNAVLPGDEIEGIKVLQSSCWGSEESVSYYIDGLLHSGDSAEFPDVEDVRLVFTACFPDYYDEYLSEFRRLKPDLVVPFHYDVDEDISQAEGLIERLREAGLNATIENIGESIAL